MRKLILLHHVSIDGFVAGPNGEMDWVTHDDEMWDAVNPILATADTALFGRRTYQLFESFWPRALDNPATDPNHLAFARWINATRKIVVSTTLERVTWANTDLVRSDAPAALTRLRAQPGNDVVVFGGPTLEAALMTLGLVDEYHIMVHPVMLGSGLSLSTHAHDRRPLTRRNVHTFRSGVVGLHYTPRN